MGTKRSLGKYAKFAIYLTAIVLINLVGITLFFRLDLTANHIFSISNVSKQVVSTLTEPLTIDVFFTKDLPAPNNGTERYLHDLLEEYGLYANHFFNYRFYDVSPEDQGGLDSRTAANRKLAADYGIHPVQIQMVENDEIKFKNAYMGLVIIHGDAIERIPAITSTAGLEYKLTTAIQKLNNKISALLALKHKVRVLLYLSSSLDKVAPLLGLKQLSNLPNTVQDLVQKLNAKNYDTLRFSRIDPTSDAVQDEIRDKYHVMSLQWPDVPKAGIEKGRGSIGLVMTYGKKAVTVPLLHVMQIPIIGTRYELMSSDELESAISGNLESLVNINQSLGMLASNGALGAAEGGRQSREDSIDNFTNLLSKTYTIDRIDLAKKDIPEDLNCLIIARPTQPFTDYELFQIDQALMRGTNLLLLTDPFVEQMPQRQQMFGFNQGPTYQRIDTGLGKLLANYGVHIDPAYVLDKDCYKQNLPKSMGGGQRDIYFAPIIKNRNIDNHLEFMKGIKGLIAVKAAPVTLDAARLKAIGVSATRLIASSKESWKMSGHIDLNPMAMTPPPADQMKGPYPLAYMLEGEFPSYFADKPIPKRIVSQKEAGAEAKASTGTTAAEKSELSMIKGEGSVIKKGKKARIIVMPASEMIRDTVIGADDDTTPNAVFIENLVDALNHRDAIAAMRAKQQRFNPLNDTPPGVKTFVKWFNIIGLPILVICFGLAVLMRRHARKRRIQMVFTTTA